MTFLQIDWVSLSLPIVEKSTVGQVYDIFCQLDGVGGNGGESIQKSLK